MTSATALRGLKTGTSGTASSESHASGRLPAQGFAYVEFLEADAVTSAALLDGSDLRGRELKVHSLSWMDSLPCTSFCAFSCSVLCKGASFSVADVPSPCHCHRNHAKGSCRNTCRERVADNAEIRIVLAYFAACIPLKPLLPLSCLELARLDTATGLDGLQQLLPP